MFQKKRTKSRKRQFGGISDVSLYGNNTFSGNTGILPSIQTYDNQPQHYVQKTRNAFPDMISDAWKGITSLLPDNVLNHKKDVNVWDSTRTMNRQDLKRVQNEMFKLDEQEQEILTEYTRSSIDLNTNLRNHKTKGFDTQNLISQVRKIDKIFSKIPPINEPLKVYRGFQHFDPINFTETMVLPYWSTSLKMQVAQSFASRYIFEILVEPGTTVLPLQQNSAYMNENEILLPRDAYIEYISHRFERGVVMMNVMDKDAEGYTVIKEIPTVREFEILTVRFKQNPNVNPLLYKNSKPENTYSKTNPDSNSKVNDFLEKWKTGEDTNKYQMYTDIKKSFDKFFPNDVLEKAFREVLLDEIDEENMTN